jgi:phytoene synthase
MQESRGITRKSASNLALAFVMLPPEKRDAMCALYAFCREVDDVADEDNRPVDDRRARLRLWRGDIQKACARLQPELPINKELQPFIAKYALPCDLFEALLDGVEMDLEKVRYTNWEELDLYCHRVASVVGLLSIRIFGETSAPCEDYAISLGKALQLTNILRDVRTDAARGRIYIPETELRGFGVAEQSILRGEWSESYARMASGMAAKAGEFYARARKVLPPESRRAMIASELMGAVYWRLLLKLRKTRYNVFAKSPVRISKAGKAAMILKAWAAYKLFGSTPRYGEI